MKRFAYAVALCLSFLLCGCFPRQLVVWAPDGKTAAVIIDEELRFCDDKGDSSTVAAKGVFLVKWFGDSKRLCLVQKRESPNWLDVEAIVGPEKAKTLIGYADQLRPRLMAGEEWDVATASLRRDHDLTEGDVLAIRQYLRETHRAELGDRVPGENVHPVKPHWRRVSVTEWSGGTLSEPRPLQEGLGDTEEVVISPNGRAIATVDYGSLYVLSADEAFPATLVRKWAARYPDWTPDSRSLAYIGGIDAQEDIRNNVGILGILTQQVLDDRGKPLAEPADSVELAWVTPTENMRVRCLDDGRILFSAHEVRLPAGPEDAVGPMQLYSIDPNRAGTVARVLPRMQDPAVLARAQFNYFDISPDGKQASVPLDDGRIAIVTLITGNIEVVQPKADLDEDLRMLPAWRSADELTFLVPAKSRDPKSPRPEVVVWSPTGIRTLSKSWPDGMMDAFRPKEDEPGKIGQPMVKPDTLAP